MIRVLAGWLRRHPEMTAYFIGVFHGAVFMAIVCSL